MYSGTNSVCLFASQSHLPFAVVGSTEEVKIGNKMVKARQYPWGTVQGKPVCTLVRKLQLALSFRRATEATSYFHSVSNSWCELAENLLRNLIHYNILSNIVV